MCRDASDASQPVKRTRRFNTRSRTGCRNCRVRRIRCDEKRPFCSNCVAKNKPCNFEPVRVPLRDLRAEIQPGEQEPWAIQAACPQKAPKVPNSDAAFAVSISWRVVPCEPLDPFSSFPIKMPLKSKELLHYFSQTGNEFGVLPRDRNDDYALSLTHDPYSLWNLLLIAGLHYALCFGDLQSFESTFLAHKIQSIRMVNEWLATNISEAKTISICAKLIATLSIIECFFGNFQVAETHLEGLIAFINAQSARQYVLDTIDSSERELIDRYLIIAYSVIQTCKKCMTDFTACSKPQDFVFPPTTVAETKDFVQKWHTFASPGVVHRLKAMRMFPMFFNSDQLGKESHRINVRPIFVCLEYATKHLDKGFTQSHAVDIRSSAALMVAASNAHISSFSGDDLRSESHSLLSSWSGNAVAVIMYLTSVVGAWNQGVPPSGRLLCHMIQILMRDLQSSSEDITHPNGEVQDLWFWKLFNGAVGLTHAHQLACDERFHDLLTIFPHNIRRWAAATSIINWVDAKHRLTNIIWPICSNQEHLAELLWTRAMQKLDNFECVSRN